VVWNGFVMLAILTLSARKSSFAGTQC